MDPVDGNFCATKKTGRFCYFTGSVSTQCGAGASLERKDLKTCDVRVGLVNFA